MLRAVQWSVVVAMLSAVTARADDKVFSGPQPGEKLTPFKVLNVLGTSAGKEIEVLGEIKGAPCVLIFVHEWTRPTFQLVRPLDSYGVKWAKDGLVTRIITLNADRAKGEQFLQGAKNSLGLRVPADVSVDGQEGPGNYGLNRKMTVTVLVAKDNKVLANFAIIQPNETDAPKVLAEVAKMLGKTAPTAEEVAAELRQPGRKPTDQAGPPAELGALMRKLIQKDNDEAAVKEVMEAMTKWAGDDAAKKTQLKEYCKKVLDLGYGNDLAKRALKRLAGD